MNTKSINRKHVIESINKMKSNKDLVRSYIKGQTDLKTVQSKGVKFAKPI